MRPGKFHVLVLLALFVTSTVVPTVAQTRDERLWQRALQIHRRAIVIDTHNDVTTPMTNDDYDLSGTPPTPYRTSIERMKKGGLTAEFFSLYVKPWYVEHGGSARRTLDMIDSVYRAVERHPRDLMLATSVADIRRAKRQGKIAALMGIEGGHAIEDSLPTLREFYRLGVRYMTLTWNNTNNWADAGRGDKKHHGLSDFGKEVVREMNRLGMMIDVSHVSDETMSDALEVSKAPIIASHSSARALSSRRFGSTWRVAFACAATSTLVTGHSNLSVPAMRRSSARSRETDTRFRAFPLPSRTSLRLVCSEP